MSGPTRVMLTPEAFSRPTGGVRRYAIELEAAVRSFADVERLGRGVGERLTPVVGRRAATAVARSWSDVSGRRSARSGDVVHSCYYDCSPLGRHLPLFVTFHDCIHERFVPGFKTKVLARDKRLSVERATKVISVSQSTAADVAQFYGLDAERSIVIAPPVSDAFTSEHDTSSTAADGVPFLLHVGARQGYKNFTLLLRAVAATSLDLRVVGGGQFTSSERAEMVSLGLGPEQVRLIVAPSDRALAALYRSSAALVCPSEFEGFGYPAAEALCVGTRVIASDGGSLSEFGRYGAVTFPANNLDALVEVLSSLGSVRRPCHEAAAAAFSRERFVREIFTVYTTCSPARRATERSNQR